MEQAVFQVLSMSIDQRVGEKERDIRRREEKISKVSRSLLGPRRRSNFEKDDFPHFILYYLVRAPHIYIYMGHRNSSFVLGFGSSLFESSFEFSFRAWLNLWF